MNKIGCSRLTAPSSDKTDITMQIHDIQTEFTPICGFSIKSEVGKAPTLINPSNATNFIFDNENIIESWMSDNNDKSEKFIKQFVTCYNFIASLTFKPKLKI